MARCVEVIYLERLSLQIDPALAKAIIAKENAVEQASTCIARKWTARN